MRNSLEPHIHNAPPVATQVIKANKSVEMIHDDGSHRFRFREPQIDGECGGGRSHRGRARANRLRSRSPHKNKSQLSRFPRHRPEYGPILVSVRLRSHRPRVPRSVVRPCSCRRWPTRGFLQNSSGLCRNDKSLQSSYLHHLSGQLKPYLKRPLLAHSGHVIHLGVALEADSDRTDQYLEVGYAQRFRAYGPRFPGDCRCDSCVRGGLSA